MGRFPLPIGSADGDISRCLAVPRSPPAGQAGGVTARITSFPIVTPPSNPPAATTDTVSTANLVTEAVC
jgi:hypothetical protein